MIIGLVYIQKGEHQRLKKILFFIALYNEGCLHSYKKLQIHFSSFDQGLDLIDSWLKTIYHFCTNCFLFRGHYFH